MNARVGTDTTIQLSVPPQALAEQYGHARYVVIPGLLPAASVSTLLAHTADTVVERSNCRNANTFGEQSFEVTHPVAEFFMRAEMLQLAQILLGSAQICRVTCWSLVYAPGEFINPHKDAAGALQALICLRAPKGRQNGGELIVDGQPFFLTPGDAIIFEATSLEHHTTPLVETADDPSPGRTVIVGRYFI